MGHILSFPHPSTFKSFQHPLWAYDTKLRCFIYSNEKHPAVNIHMKTHVVTLRLFRLFTHFYYDQIFHIFYSHHLPLRLPFLLCPSSLIHIHYQYAIFKPLLKNYSITTQVLLWEYTIKVVLGKTIPGRAVVEWHLFCARFCPHCCSTRLRSGSPHSCW